MATSKYLSDISIDGDLSVTGSYGLSSSDIPNLAASKITSGTFGTARIPSLSASKITSGTFSTARIPNLAASKITSGTTSADIIFNGRATFNGSTSETDNDGTFFNQGNYVQFSHQPMSRMWGNECLWSDKKHTVTTTGTITSPNNVFRTGDNYAIFQAATEGANPVQWTIEGTFSATTNVNARRVIIYAHGGFSCDLTIDVKNDDGTWENIYDAAYSFAGSRWHFFALTPEITYPDDWSITGIRIKFDNYGAGTNRYVGQIGITNTKDHDTFPYISQGGGKLYDSSTLSFGNSEDLKIYHDGTHSYIKDSGTGSLYIQGSGSVQIESATGENMAVFTADGAAELYHNNSKKFNTTSSGVDVSGGMKIQAASSDALLKIYNDTNSNGATIQFSDQTGQAQTGDLTFKHADSLSQGGGASFHFTSQPDTVLVVGDSTNKGRFVAYSANNAAEVDYGFADDTNTGMYSPASNQLGLVVNGSRKLFGTANGIEIQNGRLYLSTVDNNTSSTTALVLNGTEVEKRTLGSAAFSTSTDFVAVSGDSMTGDLTLASNTTLHIGNVDFTTGSGGNTVSVEAATSSGTAMNFKTSSGTVSAYMVYQGTTTTRFAGRVEPSSDRSLDLGKDSLRWRVVYCETLDSAGQHESNLQDKDQPIGQYVTGTVLSWKDGKNRPCTQFADHMRMGVAVLGQDSPLVQGAEPVLCTGVVEEGDYLVTSEKEGHAVAVPRNIVKEQMLFDCVIGKALQSSEGDSHLVKTWINI